MVSWLRAGQVFPLCKCHRCVGHASVTIAIQGCKRLQPDVVLPNAIRHALSIGDMDSNLSCCLRVTAWCAVQSLAQLIVQHSHVQRWLLKIDDEHLGRGHAYLDTAAVPGIATALQLYDATLATVSGAASRPF